MIDAATTRGYVTQEQLDAVLPLLEPASGQVDQVRTMLDEGGISVVEQEEHEGNTEEVDPEEVETRDEGPERPRASASSCTGGRHEGPQVRVGVARR